MTYSSGSAGNFTTLKSAIESACVSDGWALNSGVLSKSGRFFKLTATTVSLSLQGGSGQSGSTLTSPSPFSVKLGGPSGVVFPINYEVHSFASPDEVICVMNYNSDFYQQMSFGGTSVPNVGGSGAFLTGPYSSAQVDTPDAYNTRMYINASRANLGLTSYDGLLLGLFAVAAGSFTSSMFHCGLDGSAWLRDNSTQVSDGLIGIGYASSLLTSLPNAQNSANVLIPIKAIKPRNGGGRSVVLNMNNVRYCRNDNISPGEVITFGSEKWKVYPFLRKDASARNGVPWATGATHSGTFAYAVRYMGP